MSDWVSTFVAWPRTPELWGQVAVGVLLNLSGLVVMRWRGAGAANHPAARLQVLIALAIPLSAAGVFALGWHQAATVDPSLPDSERARLMATGLTTMMWARVYWVPLLIPAALMISVSQRRMVRRQRAELSGVARAR